MTIETFTVNAISGIYPPLYVLSFPIQILLQCLIACNKHSGCGGVIKYPANNFKCEFVVDPDEPGATPTTEKVAYRTMKYGSKTLTSVPSDPHISWDFARDECTSLNGNLPPYASTLKMRATLMIRSRGFFFLDLKRQSDGSYKDSEGVAADMSKINWSGSNPHGGNDECIGSGYDFIKYFDCPCPNNDGDSYEILCVF